MAKNYTITFKSLRAGSTYILNIGGGTGTAVALHGGVEPFTTDEDASEDQFTPIRTQSGYFRIVDNGYAANGTTAFDWKDLLPATDADRPVTLTQGGTVVWQGFMQSQTFSGALYGNPQEREFPVICPLGVLAGVDVDFKAGLKNFAYLLKSVCDTIDVKSGGTKSGDVITINGAVHITNVYVQGGYDARKWLQVKVDWQNFASEDADGVARAKYSLYEVFEDMCRFWGWTARVCGTILYLTCSDDSSEQNFLTLNRTQLNTLASAPSPIDTLTGGSESSSTVTLTDASNAHIFASTDQIDSKVQGPHRAVVKAECNEHDTIVKFAPKDIQDWIEQGSGYSWEQGDGDLVGYFSCPGGSYGKQTGANGQGNTTLKVTTVNYGGVSRRQIYQSADTESPLIGDMLMVLEGASPGGTAIQLQTLRPMSFGGGSISLSGTLWRGAEPLQDEKNKYVIRAKLGIGMTRATAKWWYMATETTGATPTISRGWQNYVSEANIPVFNIPLNGNNLKSTGTYFTIYIAGAMYAYPAIPVDANIYGYVFIDIMVGFDYHNNKNFNNFQIANFTIEYSRDSYSIPSSIGQVRPRELKQERVTTKEYSATNSNDSKEEWNANCIFASDNNMEYGYGLLLDLNGNIISTVNYGVNNEHPEQHLANRVANYWDTAKRKLDIELQAQHIGTITPKNKVAISTESGTFTPIAIGRNWRDDIVKLSLLQQ